MPPAHDDPPIELADDAEPSYPCPFCREPIKRFAIKCRWCGEAIASAQPAPVIGMRMPVAYPTNPYAAPMAPYGGGSGGMPMTAPAGTMPLVWGILGLVVCGVFAPVAWMTGRSYEQQCYALGVEPDAAGKVGKILGIIGTALMGVGCVFGVLYALLAGASGMR